MVPKDFKTGLSLLNLGRDALLASPIAHESRIYEQISQKFLPMGPDGYSTPTARLAGYSKNLNSSTSVF